MIELLQAPKCCDSIVGVIFKTLQFEAAFMDQFINSKSRQRSREVMVCSEV